MQYRERHIYESYRKKGGKESYALFRSVLASFNRRVVEQMLEGFDFNMGHRLSRLSVVRVKRDFSGRMSFDWIESGKLRREILARGGVPKGPLAPDGEEWMVYFTDDWYCRYLWEKKRCYVGNRDYYRFDPSRGVAGIKGRLVSLLKGDPLAHTRFRFN